MLEMPLPVNVIKIGEIVMEHNDNKKTFWLDYLTCDQIEPWIILSEMQELRQSLVLQTYPFRNYFH